jgi:hypothetical protein
VIVAGLAVTLLVGLFGPAERSDAAPPDQDKAKQTSAESATKDDVKPVAGTVTPEEKASEASAGDDLVTVRGRVLDLRFRVANDAFDWLRRLGHVLEMGAIVDREAFVAVVCIVHVDRLHLARGNIQTFVSDRNNARPGDRQLRHALAADASQTKSTVAVGLSVSP